MHERTPCSDQSAGNRERRLGDCRPKDNRARLAGSGGDGARRANQPGRQPDDGQHRRDSRAGRRPRAKRPGSGDYRRLAAARRSGTSHRCRDRGGQGSFRRRFGSGSGRIDAETLPAAFRQEIGQPAGVRRDQGPPPVGRSAARYGAGGRGAGTTPRSRRLGPRSVTRAFARPLPAW